ncbi:hypothetical protein QBC37DRAFT_370856 [Rhypophila decipiens]|uniref:FAD dependent oxidoreductase domain-containing protein n=1 Tax=Rhypophila decipiens TaxID=261697 RepID=A0AAN6YI43_9PEZI|nr:hypothetical protein QBC37DRAFT_370856 [Rhypophila decipiens]
MTQPQKKHIVVIGAGVIGLSSALLLLEQGCYTVTIIAEHFPGPFETIHPQEHIDYSSPWAGAHNRFIPPLPSSSSSPPDQVQSQAEREHVLALRTFSRMKSLSSGDKDPEAAQFSSVKFMKGVEFLEDPPEAYKALSGPLAAELGYENFRVLEQHEFPADGGVKWGCEYQTWCLNPMVYCCFLLRRFVNRGGRILKRRVRSVNEVFQLDLPGGDPDWNTHFGSTWLSPKNCANQQQPEEAKEVRRTTHAVVNASGNGLGDDAAMFITRGQTCVVAESGTTEEPKTVTRQNADGTWTFTVPRGAEGGTVVGGTREPDNYDPLPCPKLRDQLLERIIQTQPGLLAKGKSKLTPVRDIVGRRPTRRGGPRIEGEILNIDVRKDKKQQGFVMHAYGMGGRGYELSWGVAEEVVNGVSEYFLERSGSAPGGVSKL